MVFTHTVHSVGQLGACGAIGNCIHWSAPVVPFIVQPLGQQVKGAAANHSLKRTAGVGLAVKIVAFAAGGRLAQALGAQTRNDQSRSLDRIGMRPNGCVLKSRAAASEYLSSRNDISAEFRKAIENGQVLIGMSPEEASVAGGANMFDIDRDRTVWPKEETDPGAFSLRKGCIPTTARLSCILKTGFNSARRRRCVSPQYLCVGASPV